MLLNVDKLWERTMAATGASRTTVHRIVLSKAGQLSGSVPVDSSDKPVLENMSKRPARRPVDKFNQDLIRRTVFAFHNETCKDPGQNQGLD